jgi:hypothetical protein
MFVGHRSLMLSCLDVAFPTAGIGTELLAHREKIEVTRFQLTI